MRSTNYTLSAVQLFESSSRAPCPPPIARSPSGTSSRPLRSDVSRQLKQSKNAHQKPQLKGARQHYRQTQEQSKIAGPHWGDGGGERGLGEELRPARDGGRWDGDTDGGDVREGGADLPSELAPVPGEDALPRPAGEGGKVGGEGKGRAKQRDIWLQGAVAAPRTSVVREWEVLLAGASISSNICLVFRENVKMCRRNFFLSHVLLWISIPCWLKIQNISWLLTCGMLQIILNNDLFTYDYITKYTDKIPLKV